MMSDMDDMMKATDDQLLKNRMQKMRAQMKGMTAKMDKHGMGMMERGDRRGREIPRAVHPLRRKIKRTVVKPSTASSFLRSKAAVFTAFPCQE